MPVGQYLRGGVYARSKKELRPLLAGDEAELLRLGMDPARFGDRLRNDPDALYRLLLDWSGKVLRELAQLDAECGE